MTIKTLIGLVAFLITLVCLAGAGTLYWGLYNLHKPKIHDKFVEITIERGSSVRKIADTLRQKDILDKKFDTILFETFVRLKGMDNSLHAGEYKLEKNMSIEDIAELFKSGKTIQRQITIREGLTSYEIVQLLKTVEELTGEIEIIPTEGMLLPETYSYTRNESRMDVLKRMESAMVETLTSAWETKAENLPFKTKEDALILASIVEKETAVPEERRRVAGVFINRLKKGIALQTDPTVIYALTQGKHKNDGKGPLGRRLLRKDLEIDSPYNTYRYPGLPPGPIANPGKASIEAVLNPEDHDFIYFVADGTGGHVFAKTLTEHNRNVAKWRKVRKKQK